jgi:DNA-binding FadR family transcriptional regulator
VSALYACGVSRWLSDIGLRLDRSSDVPVGLQLAWGLRAAIELGTLEPGERLPPLRELAEALGVNPGTVRAVVARLAQEGFLVPRHGDGTFVAEDPPGEDGLDGALEAARRAAASAGIPARSLATALWTAAGPDAARSDEAAARRGVRRDIAVLERLLAERRQQVPPPKQAGPSRSPRLLGLAELEAQRDALLHLLAQRSAPEEAAEPAPEGLPTETDRGRERGAPRPSTRPALP